MMVEHQREKYGWEFIFMGAGIDAWDVGRTMGFGKNDCYSFAKTKEGVNASYVTASCRTTSYRIGKPADNNTLESQLKGVTHVIKS